MHKILKSKNRAQVNPVPEKQNISFTASNVDSESVNSYSEEEKSFRTQVGKQGSQSSKRSASNSRTQTLASSKRSKKSDLVLRRYHGISRILCFLPQSMIVLVFKIPIAFKLLALIVLPILVLLGVLIFSIIDIALQVAIFQNANNSLEVIDTLSQVSNALNIERGTIISSIYAPGDTTIRDQAFETTDTHMKELNQLLNDYETSSALTNKLLSESKELTSRIYSIRSTAVSTSNETYIFENYDSAIATLNSVIEQIAWDPNFKVISSYGHMLKYIQMYTTSIGRLRDGLAYYSRFGYFLSEAEYLSTVTLIGEMNSYYDQSVNSRIITLNIHSSTILELDIDITEIPSFVWYNNLCIEVVLGGLYQNITVSTSDILANGFVLTSLLDSISEQQIDLMRETLSKEIRNNEIQYIILTSIFVITFIISCVLICSCTLCIRLPWAFMTKKREESIKAATTLADAILRLDPDLMDEKKLKTDDSMLSPLELALKHIALNFIQFQPYIPQAVIATVRGAYSEETTESTRKIGQNTPIQAQSTFRDLNSSFTPSFTGDRSERSLSTTKRRENYTAARASVHQSLHYKEIAVLLIDIAETHDLFDGFSSGDIVETHADLMNAIHDIVNEQKGVLEVVQDKFVCSFNAITPTLGPEQNACSAAIAISMVLETKLIPDWKKNELPPLQVNMAIVSGNAYVGPVGTKRIQSFVTFSPMLTKLWKMVKLNKTYMNEKHIIIDDNTAKKIDIHFRMQALDIVTISNKSELLFSLVSQHTFKNDEWMYEYTELENMKEKGKDVLLDAWRYLLRNDVEEARNHLQLYLKLISEEEELIALNIASVERLEANISKFEKGNSVSEK